MFFAPTINRPIQRKLLLAAHSLAMLVALAIPASALETSATTQPATKPTTAPADIHLISKSLSDLASQDSAVREAARVQLMSLSRVDLPALQRLIERNQPLAPSQAVALRQIVCEIYLGGEAYEKDGTKGFLGILMKGSLGNRDLQQPNDNVLMPGVVVEDRIPGFCASRLLRDGDIILGTADAAQVFHSPTDLQFAIAGLDPGSLVRLQVLRQGQVIEVRLTLDSRPMEADGIDAAENFRDRRMKKFDEYWQKSFAALLKETAG